MNCYCSYDERSVLKLGKKFWPYSQKVQLRRFQMDSYWTSFGGSHFRHNLVGTPTPHSDFRRHGVSTELQHCERTYNQIIIFILRKKYFSIFQIRVGHIQNLTIHLTSKAIYFCHAYKYCLGCLCKSFLSTHVELNTIKFKQNKTKQS
jgi:hypothetical protein